MDGRRGEPQHTTVARLTNGANTFAPANRASPNPSIALGSSLPWAEGTHFAVVSTHPPSASTSSPRSLFSVHSSPSLQVLRLVARPQATLLLLHVFGEQRRCRFIHPTRPAAPCFWRYCPAVFFPISVCHCPRRALQSPHFASRVRKVRNRLAHD